MVILGHFRARKWFLGSEKISLPGAKRREGENKEIFFEFFKKSSKKVVPGGFHKSAKEGHWERPSKVQKKLWKHCRGGPLCIKTCIGGRFFLETLY